MNSIMGFSEIALDSEVSPETRSYILKIKDSTILLLRVINVILDISKIEAGKMEMESISFCPGNVITNCQTMIAQFINEKGLEFKIHIDETLMEMQLMGDPVRLYQAILNLLSNAAKFTARGTVSLNATLAGSDSEYATVCFEIIDSGIGMNDEQLEYVFEPFAQVDSESTRAQDGTGLGLPITKNIIELMGGSLTAESKLGEGSTFRILLKLPLTDSEGLFDDAFGESVPDHIERPHFEGEILVCEDNRLNQQVIQEHLRRVGLSTVIAENGLEGLKIVMDRMKKKQKPFDMILMDMQMPVMDGFEATARINALGTGVPIVALTANVMTTDLEDYKRNGLMDCIGKPFQTWDLWRCLLSFLMPVSKSVVESREVNQSDEALLVQLRRNFPNENKSRIEEIQNALDTLDLKTARLYAHTLKSNAGLIKEHRLQELAATVEKMLENDKVDEIAPHMSHLGSELRMVLDKLEEYVSRIGSAVPDAVDESFNSTDIADGDKVGILIVDDEKSNIIALAHFLRDEYAIFVTRDSRDALEMAEEHTPGIILLDILMPEMDGYEVMAALNGSEKAKNIPVIFISGLTSPEAMKKGLAMGAADYIPKPFQSSVVKEKIKKALEHVAEKG